MSRIAPRRRFLKDLVYGLLVTIAGFGIWALFSDKEDAPDWEGFVLDRDGKRIDPERIRPGAAKSARVRDLKLVILHTEKGFSAMSAKCTHQGCTVRWNPIDLHIHCPCHGALYDTMGNVLYGPAERPLERLKLEVREGALYIIGSERPRA